MLELANMTGKCYVCGCVPMSKAATGGCMYGSAERTIVVACLDMRMQCPCKLEQTHHMRTSIAAAVAVSQP